MPKNISSMFEGEKKTLLGQNTTYFCAKWHLKPSKLTFKNISLGSCHTEKLLIVSLIILNPKYRKYADSFRIETAKFKDLKESLVSSISSQHPKKV